MGDPNDPLIGTVVAGRYRVERPLGEGGMGQVYLAEHEAIQKKIALKVLRPEYAMKGDIVTRFQQEAISASRIKHPNVLDVFDFGRIETGAFYLAMEFLEGHDLAQEITRSHVIDPERGLRFAQQIVKALGAAHAKGVVHRDMKPENVFLQRTTDGDELVKIVDFGIAQLRTNEEAASEAKPRRLTRTGMIFGTPEYMSPEQAGGKHADQRADVYAVGIILYEMFTGAVPFTGDTFLGVLAKHMNEPTPAMSAVYPELAISKELQAVILRALEKDPAARFQTMPEFSQALAGTPEGRGVFSQRVALVASPTLFQEPGAPTAPQFRVHGPESRAQTVAANPLANVPISQVQPSLAMPAATAGDAARAVTAGATTSTVAPGKSRSGVLLGSGLAVLVAGAAAGVIYSKRGVVEPAKETLAESPPALVKVSAAPFNTPVVVPDPTPPAPSVSVAATIRLSVETDPPGATVSKNGFQVCDQAPCEVTATPNETLELSAVKGTLKGSAKVLAQRDQRVAIRLAGANAPARPSAAPKPSGKPQCEMMVGDLKILRDCP
jgi:serine/threonine-protein kinase